MESLDSWSDIQLKQAAPKVCRDMQTGLKGILTVGLTLKWFYIITTDMFVYELSQKQLNPNFHPPYKIIVDKDPKHFRHRWPKSYPKIRSLVKSFQYSFIFSMIDSEYDYLIFIYKRENNFCALVMDMNQDSIEDEALCDPPFPEFRIITTLPSNFYMGSIIKNKEQKTCFDIMVFAELSSISVEMTKKYRLKDANVAIIASEYMMDVERCHRISAPIINGFAYAPSVTYVIDSNNMVSRLDEIYFPSESSRQSIKDFIGCYEVPIYRFNFNMVYTLKVIFVIIMIQLIMCMLVYIYISQALKAKPRLIRRQSPLSTKSHSKLESTSRKSSSTLGRSSQGSKISKSTIGLSRKSQNSKLSLRRRSSGKVSVKDCNSAVSKMSSSHHSIAAPQTITMTETKQESTKN